MSTITIQINQSMNEILKMHLFQNGLEQGAFLMTRATIDNSNIVIRAVDYYLVPPEGWIAQLDVYLEMTDEERGKIMQKARKGDFGIIDIHSHPGSGSDVWFSPSDISGIREFAAYANWKLPGQPYVAMVWGEKSFDGVAWHGAFTTPEPITKLEFYSDTGAITSSAPAGSWFGTRRGYNRK